MRPCPCRLIGQDLGLSIRRSGFDSRQGHKRSRPCSIVEYAPGYEPGTRRFDSCRGHLGGALGKRVGHQIRSSARFDSLVSCNGHRSQVERRWAATPLIPSSNLGGVSIVLQRGGLVSQRFHTPCKPVQLWPLQLQRMHVAVLWHRSRTCVDRCCTTSNELDGVQHWRQKFV